MPSSLRWVDVRWPREGQLAPLPDFKEGSERIVSVEEFALLSDGPDTGYWARVWIQTYHA